MPLRRRLSRFLRKPLPEQWAAGRATLRAMLRGETGHLGGLYNLEIIQRRVHTLAVIERERYVKELLAGPRYDDPKRLERHGLKVYSQNDEDGILQEIFSRIGTTSRTFVEFGVENGLENNTLKLLLEGWRGLWIEGDDGCVAQIDQKFRDVVSEGRLRLTAAFINRDNINRLIGAHFTGEIDLLSIDIDGNDIYILETIDVISPRVIIVEYNGKFPPPLSIAQRYNPEHRWAKTDYGGASLAAITKVAHRQGYSLVGCGIVGVNAFFVRNDLVGNKFHEPFTAENHYQPARYFLWQTYVSGHSPDWGPYEVV
ncbi:MAG: hypothetical protein ACREE2_10690 [Stellaceae bacterium]